MTGAHIIAGRRSPVAVRGGGFAQLGVAELGAPVLRQALADCGISVGDVDGVILGNALYAGGNPARVVALAAGLSETTGAMTVDTQCCGGLDSIALAKAQIEAGMADVIVAGGVESYSRAPIRQRRPRSPGDLPVEYNSPPFTPWPDRDPDMIESAAALAAEQQVSRRQQEAFAVESHRRAGSDHLIVREITPVNGLSKDEFTRNLTPALCERLGVLAGEEDWGVTAATTAVEADAAAIVVVASARTVKRLGRAGGSVEIVASAAMGGDPTRPALAPIAAAKAALSSAKLRADEVTVAEIMEAFAVQAMACIDGIALTPEIVNQRGGALARGHPIGASGAILAVRLFHDLNVASETTHGLAAIAAAGGLGSALVLRGGGR